MAILDIKPKNFKPGDAVTADVVNDTIDTAIHARFKSESALFEAMLAEKNSQEVQTKAEQAFGNSVEARDLSIASNSNTVEALGKIEAFMNRVDKKEFHGADGNHAVLVEAVGRYGFQIRDENLWLNFTGDVTPDFTLNESGELIYNF